jgi:hypothetical protein
MKLPILGILIVIFLQLGFTAYNALDRPIESLVVINAVAVGGNSVAGLPDDSITGADYYVNDRPRFRTAKNGDFTIATANVRKSRRAAVPIIVFTNTVVKIPAAKPDSQLVAFQKSWESSKNNYPQPMRPGGESENFPVKDRSSEKRSFVAKSASVLKKPYDWLKALGSKIN